MTGGIIMLVAVVASIMVHEAGHYFAARAVGIKATEFFFGFGPKIWSTKRGETEFGVKAIPLGGYVRIAGMDPFEEVDPEDRGRTYRDKKFWQKSLVVMAGVILHFFMAYVLLFGVIVGYGLENPDKPLTTVAFVQTTLDDGSPAPAALAGLKPGDTIVAVDGTPVDSWDALSAAIAAHPGDSVELTVERDGQMITIEATLAAAPDTGKGYLGISPAYQRDPVPVFTAAGLAGRTVGGLTLETFKAIGNLVKPSSLARLAGAFVGNTDVPDEIRPVSPVGIVRLGEGLDLRSLLGLIAMVNVVLGVFNGLPLFPLDGGHFVVALWERITHREVDMRKMMPVAAAVMALVIFLFSVALLLDIVNPITLGG